MTLITLQDEQLAYTALGSPENPPIICLHGWGSYRGIWRSTVTALQDRYYCVAVDLLGFGESDKPNEADYSIEAQARRVLALADALGLDRFSVMGHSMGGQTALCLAAIVAPNRIEKVISVAGVVAGRLSPFVEDFLYPYVALGRTMPLFMSAAITSLIDYRWLYYWGGNGWLFDVPPQHFIDWLGERLAVWQPNIHVSLYEAGEALHALDLTPSLPQITAPTLAIWGQGDVVVPLSDGKLIAQHVPEGRLVVLENCAHFPMYEQATQYQTIIDTFLAN